MSLFAGSSVGCSRALPPQAEVLQKKAIEGA